AGEERDDVAVEVPRHIEVVDGLVAEDAAGGAQVLDRRRGGVAADDRQLLEGSDLSGDETFPSCGEVAVEPPVEADGERNAGVLDQGRQFVDAGDVEVDRLLAENRD